MNDKRFNNKNLKAAIDKSGLTREQIAASVGCDTSSITKYYNGDRFPKTDIIIRLAELFNCSTDYLLGVSDVFTTDNALKFVCDYVKLSENSIKTLKQADKIHPYINEQIAFADDNADIIGDYTDLKNELYRMRSLFREGIIYKNNNTDIKFTDDFDITDFLNNISVWGSVQLDLFFSTQYRIKSAYDKILNPETIDTTVKLIEFLYKNYSDNGFINSELNVDITYNGDADE